MIDALPQGSRIVFTGDSVTDCARRGDAAPLGNGYVSLIAQNLGENRPDLTFVNTGINGNRSADLLARWPQDVLAHDPALVSVLIGINDTWRKYDRNESTSARDYDKNIRALSALTPAAVRVIFVSPFLLPVTPEQKEWRKDLDPKIEAMRRVAAESGFTFLDADTVMTAAAATHGASALAPDGVHPSAEGHRLLAEAWLDLVARAG